MLFIEANDGMVWHGASNLLHPFGIQTAAAVSSRAER